MTPSFALLVLGGRELAVFLLSCFLAYCAGRIAKQAGYSMLWGLTMLIPIVNVIVLVIFAFSVWPRSKNG